MKRDEKKQGYRSGIKIIAIVLVCLFTLNSISNGIPNDISVTNPANVDSPTIATESIFKALHDEGIEDSAEMVFELISGMRLLLAGKNAPTVNAFLTETYKNSKDKRKIEFFQDVDQSYGSEKIKAEFTVKGRENLIFEIEYKGIKTQETSANRDNADIVRTGKSGIVVDAQDIIRTGEISKKELATMICAMNREAFYDGVEEEAWDNIWIPLWMNKFDDQESRIYVYFTYDNKINGYLDFNVQRGMSKNDSFSEASSMVIKEKEQGKGGGELLLDAYFQYLKDEGIYQVEMVEVIDEARKYYAKYFASRGIEGFGEYSMFGTSTFQVDVRDLTIPQEYRRYGNDIDVKDSDLSKILPFKEITFDNIFQKGDEISIKMIEKGIPVLYQKLDTLGRELGIEVKVNTEKDMPITGNIDTVSVLASLIRDLARVPGEKLLAEVNDDNGISLEITGTFESAFKGYEKTSVFQDIKKEIFLSGGFFGMPERLWSDSEKRYVVRFRIDFPEEPCIVMKAWDTDREIESKTRDIKDETGDMINKYADTFLAYIYTFDLGALDKFFSKGLKGAEVLFMGPGGTARDIFSFLDNYPEVKAIHLVDISEFAFLDMREELKRSGRKMPPIFGYRASVLDLPEELTGKIGLAFDKFVFTDEFFSLAQLKRSGSEIFKILRPGGMHITVGGYQFPQEAYSDIPDMNMINTGQRQDFRLFRKSEISSEEDDSAGEEDIFNKKLNEIEKEAEVIVKSLKATGVQFSRVSDILEQRSLRKILIRTEEELKKAIKEYEDAVIAMERMEGLNREAVAEARLKMKKYGDRIELVREEFGRVFARVMRDIWMTQGSDAAETFRSREKRAGILKLSKNVDASYKKLENMFHVMETRVYLNAYRNALMTDIKEKVKRIVETGKSTIEIWDKKGIKEGVDSSLADRIKDTLAELGKLIVLSGDIYKKVSERRYTEGVARGLEEMSSYVGNKAREVRAADAKLEGIQERIDVLMEILPDAAENENMPDNGSSVKEYPGRVKDARDMAKLKQMVEQELAVIGDIDVFFQKIEKEIFLYETLSDEEKQVAASIDAAGFRYHDFKYGNEALAKKIAILKDQEKHNNVFSYYKDEYYFHKSGFIDTLEKCKDPEIFGEEENSLRKKLLAHREDLIKAIGNIVLCNNLYVRHKYIYKTGDDGEEEITDDISRAKAVGLNASIIYYILKDAGIKKGDVVLDMFSGRGNLLSFLRGYTDAGQIMISDIDYGIYGGTRDMRYAVKENLEEVDRLFEFLPEGMRPGFKEVDVVQADALELSLGDASIDKIITDPPYGREGKGLSEVDAFLLFMGSLRESYRILKEDGMARFSVPSNWAEWMQENIKQDILERSPEELFSSFCELIKRSIYCEKVYYNKGLSFPEQNYEEKDWVEVKGIMHELFVRPRGFNFKTFQVEPVFTIPVNIIELKIASKREMRDQPKKDMAKDHIGPGNMIHYNTAIDARVIVESGQMTEERLAEGLHSVTMKACLKTKFVEEFDHIYVNSWVKRIRDQGFFTYVYLNERGQASGYLKFLISRGGESEGLVAVISDIAVEPSAQGKGAAKLLLDKCFQFVKNKGIKEAVLMDLEPGMDKFYNKYFRSRGMAGLNEGIKFANNIYRVFLPGFDKGNSKGEKKDRIIVPDAMPKEKQFIKENKDENLILARAARHLKQKPVNMYVDLTSIPQEEDQLEENMETLALLITRNKKFGLNVRYILENARSNIALVFLKKKLMAAADLSGIDADELLACMKEAHSGKDVIDIKLENIKNIKKEQEIRDREYIIALQDDITKEGAAIPNYSAASVMGLSLASLCVAVDRLKDRPQERQEYETLRDEIVEKFRGIYERYGVKLIDGRSDFSGDELDFMVRGSSDTKLYLTIFYALPPAVKATEGIHEYHKLMQMILRAA